jgi:DNA polymerase III subunit epsilon
MAVPPTFVAIDFETADYGRDSACAVGLVRVEGRLIVERRAWLIRPPRRDFVFTYIHGITWPMVSRQPDFSRVWPEAGRMLEGADFLVAHNESFDRGVLAACCAVAGLAPPALPFLCSMQMARRVLGIRPSRLDHVCSVLGIELRHHDALSDAEAAARIALTALARQAAG